MFVQLDEKKPADADLELMKLLRLVDEFSFRATLYDMAHSSLSAFTAMERIHTLVSQTVDMGKIFRGPGGTTAVLQTAADGFDNPLALRLLPGSFLNSELRRSEKIPAAMNALVLQFQVPLNAQTVEGQLSSGTYRLYLSEKEARLESLHQKVQPAVTKTAQPLLMVQIGQRELYLPTGAAYQSEWSFHAAEAVKVLQGEACFPASFTDQMVMLPAKAQGTVVHIGRSRAPDAVDISHMAFVRSLGRYACYRPLDAADYYYLNLDEVKIMLREELGASHLLRPQPAKEVDEALKNSDFMLGWESELGKAMRDLRQLRQLNRFIREQEEQRSQVGS